MTSRKHQKRLAHARAAKTGESYTTALRHLRDRLTRGGDMAPNETSARPLVKCSFCNKGNSEVKKIIAGPGVYICNECIGLCNDLIERETSEEDAKRQLEQFLRPSAEMLLTRVRGLSRTMEDMEADLRRWVSQARQEFGVGWQRLAVELGSTPEAARDRFRERTDER